jgi:hypothetical protein
MSSSSCITFGHAKAAEYRACDVGIATAAPDDEGDTRSKSVCNRAAGAGRPYSNRAHE